MHRDLAAALAAATLLAATGCQDGHAGVPPPAPGSRSGVQVPGGPSTDGPDATSPGRPVTLGFAGDVHFQLNLSPLVDHPRGALGPEARVLRAPDLMMVNFESTLTADGTPDPKELEVPAQRFWYRAPPAALEVLGQAGVDVMTVANNHGADYGADGLADTLRAARHSPVAVVGVGRDRAAAFAPHEVTVHGTDLAFLAADTTPREGSSRVWEAGAHSAGIAAARGEHTRTLLRAVRRAGAGDDVVVVYLHWGIDLRPCPSAAQVRLAHDLAAAGADVVVGTHVHVLQGAGWLGDTYVAYGLGNFLWYHDHEPDTGVLRLRVMDGHVVSDGWAPARIPDIGPPRPLHGAARAAAITDWRRLRACAGLAARPGVAAGGSSVTPPRTGPTVPAASVRRIGPGLRARMASSQGPGCPVPWSRLRYLRLPYTGFDGRDHLGELVVAARYVHDLVDVFERLHDERWPIRQMRLVSDFGGDDGRSMAADNTSAYNCRRVAGSRHWSAHALGAAVDINPVENPYLLDGSVHPSSGRPFARLDREPGSTVPPGTIRQGDVVVDAFAAVGWEWGGTWASPDFQHFTGVRR